MDLIDSHVHLLLPSRFRYDWCAAVPALQREFSLADYRAALRAGPDGLRVREVVVMEADVPVAEQQAEADYFDALARRQSDEPRLAAVIAGLHPEAAEFSRGLAARRSRPSVRGVRRVLHPVPGSVPSAAGFAENLRQLAPAGFTFDLCLRPPLLPAITELVARCPETQFVLDHCGVPNVAKGELEPWRDDLRRLAQRPNVVCKFSGLAGCADPARPLTPQLRPYFHHCLACFGADRLMWGSDWPVCCLEIELGAWLSATAELLGEISPAEAALIAAGTARRVYRLEAPRPA